MQVQFATARLQKQLNSKKELKKQFGDVGAKKLSTRLSNLEAAETLADMWHLPGRCHPLSGDRAGCFALDLVHPFRLVFRPTEPVPLKDDGGIDLERVDSVVITEVVDYH